MPDNYHLIMESIGWRTAGLILFAIPIIFVLIIATWLITSHIKRKRYKAENTAKQREKVEQLNANRQEG